MSPQTVTGHFCAIVSVCGECRAVHIPRVVRSTRPGEPRGPVPRLDQHTAHVNQGQEGQSWHTFSHSLWTSLSASCLHVMRLSIQPSSVGIVAGSEAGADDRCTGSGILTSSMLVSMVVGWWQVVGVKLVVVLSRRGVAALQTWRMTCKGRASDGGGWGSKNAAERVSWRGEGCQKQCRDREWYTRTLARQCTALGCGCPASEEGVTDVSRGRFSLIDTVAKGNACSRASVPAATVNHPQLEALRNFSSHNKNTHTT
jgi:hypothetical protein